MNTHDHQALVKLAMAAVRAVEPTPLARSARQVHRRDDPLLDDQSCLRAQDSPAGEAVAE